MIVKVKRVNLPIGNMLPGSIEIIPVEKTDPPFLPERFLKLTIEYRKDSGAVCLEGVHVYQLCLREFDLSLEPDDIIEVRSGDLVWSRRSRLDNEEFAPWGTPGDREKTASVLFGP